MQVGVGNPPTQCEYSRSTYDDYPSDMLADSLLVDTGSSNTWIGAGKAYQRTSSSVMTNDAVVSTTFIDVVNFTDSSGSLSRMVRDPSLVCRMVMPYGTPPER